MEKLVSILMPAYNAERWIKAAIESALCQTWPRKEIIVVDDGSTDRTRLIAEGLSSRCVCVIHQENRGAAAARNTALANCHGDYIQWLDADDLLAPDKVRLQMEALGNNPDERILLSSAWGRFISRPHKAKFRPSSLWADLLPVEWMLRYLERRHWMQTATWLVSRELTEASGPWDTRLLGDDDGEYFCRVILQSTGVRFVPEARVLYRRTDNSLSYLGGGRKKLEAQFLSMELQFNELRSFEDSERVRRACLDYLQHFLVYFYPEMFEVLERADALAASLEGRLRVPELSWKYAWIQRLFGWTLAKRTQMQYNKLKSSLLGAFDRVLFQLGM